MLTLVLLIYLAIEKDSIVALTVATVLSAAAVGNFENYLEAILVGN